VKFYTLIVCLYSHNIAKGDSSPHFSSPDFMTNLLDFFCNHVLISQYTECLENKGVHHICAAEKHHHSKNIINNLPMTVGTQSIHQHRAKKTWGFFKSPTQWVFCVLLGFGVLLAFWTSRKK